MSTANPQNPQTNFSTPQLENIEQQLQEHMRASQKKELQFERMQSSMEMLQRKYRGDEAKQTILALEKKLAHKEDELLTLRWAVQVGFCHPPFQLNGMDARKTE